jgi:cobalamin biosynthetic protein CobC
MLEHGGTIRQAARIYGIPPSEWLDLSTGINPLGWPVPEIPPSAWQRLPESKDELEQAAQKYYAIEFFLSVAGAQAAIQTLPNLRPSCRVGLIATSYLEHQRTWSQQGHQVLTLRYDQLADASQTLDVIVVCNPNNPTGTILSVHELLNLYERLAARDGWLIVDESFIDTTPDLSITAEVGKEGLIVLRSLGKFFGLAGARIGFIFAWQDLLSSLNERMGPWSVNGPARWAASRALGDQLWQENARAWLIVQSKRLAALLRGFGFTVAGGTHFFQWVVDDRAQALHEFLAREAILSRLFQEPKSIRIGLPPDESGWSRLTSALDAFAANSNSHTQEFSPATAPVPRAETQ